MKKKLLVTVLTVALACSALACGKKEEAAPAADVAVESEAPAVESEVVESEVVETEVISEEASTELGSWADLADVFTECYMGMNGEDEAVVFLISADGTMGVISFANTDAQSASFVGALTDNGDGTMTVEDESSQTTLTFGVTDNGDGTFALDLGDLGTAVVETCDQALAFETLDTIDAAFTPVN